MEGDRDEICMWRAVDLKRRESSLDRFNVYLRVLNLNRG